MNTSKKTLILLPTLILIAASLACGPLTPPTPTPEPTNTPEPTETPIPTPTLTPTPTPIPLPEMTFYISAQMGLSIDYPVDWYMEEGGDTSSSSVVFATKADFEPNEEEGAIFVAISLPVAGLGVSDIEELWDGLSSEMADEDIQIGEPESFTVGSQDGVKGTYESKEDDYYGWIVMVLTNDYGYAFLAVCSPTENWEDYEATFDEMFASAKFFEPGAGGDDGSTFTSRTDIPIPDDAEIQLDMTTMFSYLTEASIIDAARFCEENWPDHGWTANKDDILYTVSEETGLLFFSKDAETALVAITIDDDTGKTMVSIIISEE